MGTDDPGDDKIAQLPGVPSWRGSLDAESAQLQRLIGYFLKLQRPQNRDYILQFAKIIYDVEQYEIEDEGK